jgi:uroporphyrinogen decarboxylase
MPFAFGGPREATFRAWSRQGLTDELRRRWHEFTGADGWAWPGMFYDGPLPPFEETVLEEKDNKRTWIDHWGVKRVDAIVQPTDGFAPRQYLEFPVKTLDDFEEMKRRFDPRTPARYRPDPAEAARTQMTPDGYRRYPMGECWEDRVEQCNSGGLPVRIGIAGLFWRARDWTGLEDLAVMFKLQPALVHEMMEFWTGFLMDMLDEPLRRLQVEEVMLNEDMAYKTASMISPADMREFMLPRYERLHRFFHERGVHALVMDSDGHNGQILDVFHPAEQADAPVAIDGICPMEIAAGNDPAVYLARYPKLFIWGGIDKRELRGSRERVRAEVVRRYRAAREFGGYLPTVDHGVPPDVPLRNYLHMVELIKGFAQGRDLETYEPPCELEQALGEVEEEFDARREIERAYGD